MRNLISLILFTIFAWLGLWWYYSCDWCQNKTLATTLPAETIPKEDTIQTKEEPLSVFKITDSDGNEIFSFEDDLKINSENGKVIIPDSLSGFENKIVEYLAQHQDQELIIYGYETFNESNHQKQYGIARANFIKDLITQAGSNPDRILTHPKSVDYSYDEQGIYRGGLVLKFHPLDASRIKEVEESIEHKTLYSNFGQKSFKPDPTLINYTIDLKNYLNKYPNKKIKLVGHTDNIGNEKANIKFGKQRADFVKKYLVSQGISDSKITASSKGESEPSVPNNTKENRAKNRRIEITIN